jgi:hypothetical protein
MTRRRLRITLAFPLFLLLGWAIVEPSRCQSPDSSKAAAVFRKAGQPVEPVSDTTIIAEAEEFQVEKPGWQAKKWGENYYVATFANSFLSRKAFLGAPEQSERSVASLSVKVPKAGKYLALVRYEAPYRFETQFRLQVEQNGKTKLDRLYGARGNIKIWAFREKLKAEVAWGWGAVENFVWEGHDAFVELDAGTARLSLIADKQPTPAARRNVDLVMLTSDADQVKMRIEKENYLPLDGMLTQAGDVFLKLHNQKDGVPMTLTVPHGTEHSPYWVHIRSWKPLTIKAEPGQSSDWVEVGSLLDTLNDGQWGLTVASPGRKPGEGKFSFALEFGVKTADGKIETIRRFEKLTGNVTLAYAADTRYSRRIRLADDVLYDLVDYLKKQPVQGRPPNRTLIYGYTFTQQPGNEKYNAALDEFNRLIGATALTIGSRNEIPSDGLVRGYIDLRSVPTNKLAEHCEKLQAEGKANRIAVVSLGDEIGLAAPPAKDHAGFREWLKARNIKPAEIVPGTEDWNKIEYSPTPATAKSNPTLFYYSKIYSYRYGINQLKARTDILKKYLPNAGIGANFSPHHKHMYLGDTHHWISLFREGGMTMPWGEDYIWQVPVGTQQMNFLMVDMFRAGIRGKPDAKIHYYVMPHTPGNTPASWRRQFYGDIAHGVKVFNLFEFHPVEAAYTENHCSDPTMYQAVRRSLHELGTFEDIVQDGQVQPGVAGLWFSEAADVWDDNRHPFDAAKRCLYIALLHSQVPLDVVVEGDDLKGYKALYLTDAHVSRAASKAIADWVHSGGQLFATAGAGMFDELNQPNTTLRELLGVEQKELETAKEDPIRFEKQDLPFAKPLDQVTAKATGAGTAAIPVIGLRSRAVVKGAEVTHQFGDSSPAVAARKVGTGRVVWIGFLPGLSYFKPAIPLRPVDRGATDDTMAHFLPTQFDRQTAQLLDLAAVPQPVVCSEPLVENRVIQAKQGVLIPLINWSAGPVKGLTVTVSIEVPKKATLASGKPVQVSSKEGKTVFTLDLEEADALILRK